ncbi:hypothetical protein [Bradyrhizobium sp. UFLA05-112]
MGQIVRASAGSRVLQGAPRQDGVSPPIYLDVSMISQNPLRLAPPVGGYYAWGCFRRFAGTTANGAIRWRRPPET